MLGAVFAALHVLQRTMWVWCVQGGGGVDGNTTGEI